MSLNQYVFNTEAHPLPLLSSTQHADLRPKFAKGPDDIDLAAAGYSPAVLQQAIAFYRAQLPRDLYVDAAGT